MGKTVRNLVGQSFGRLSVIERAESRNGKAYWLCRCDCGNYKTVSGTHLVDGSTQSCGCLVKEVNSRNNTLNLVGKQFGRLTVLSMCKETNKRSHLWLCSCTCGNTVIVPTSKLTKGNTRSCGCLQKERASISNRVHGETGTPLYWVWAAMIQRCTNPKNKNFNIYGGRGISVCQEWLHSYPTFSIWAYANGYKEGLTIDRKDNNANYSPENCRFVTMKEQAHNRRTNSNITVNGITHCMTEWERLLDLKKDTLYNLKKNGINLEEYIKENFYGK